MGLHSPQGWIPGILDELKLYGSAVYPDTGTMPKPAQNAAPAHSEIR